MLPREQDLVGGVQAVLKVLKKKFLRIILISVLVDIDFPIRTNNGTAQVVRTTQQHEC